MAEADQEFIDEGEEGTLDSVIAALTILSKEKKTDHKLSRSRPDYAFCPTGEGGGIDNSCGPGGGGAHEAHVKGTVYHGTRSRVVGKIKKEGLKVGKSAMGRPPSVYFTTSEKFAKEFGELFVSSGGKGTFAVVEFQIPSGGAKVIHDEAPSMKASFRIEKNIPPSWIKGIKIYDENTGKLIKKA